MRDHQPQGASDDRSLAGFDFYRADSPCCYPGCYLLQHNCSVRGVQDDAMCRQRMLTLVATSWGDKGPLMVPSLLSAGARLE